MSAPVVTGVAPKEGPPGTKITIRGENLGLSQNDVLGVAICNKNCSMSAEWISASKIVCRTSTGSGKHSIIVITKSGGCGTSTVNFTGLPQPPVGPLESSPVWVDETKYVDQRLDRSQKTTALSLRTDPLGLNTEDLGHSVGQSYMQLAELFPKGSPDPTDGNFVPSWFLVEKHRHTSFAELKEGHAYMRKRANQNTSNAPLNHVKDSLPVFFEVHETLSGVYFKMQNADLGSGVGSMTDNLEDTLNEASKKANDLFETVLSSKDRADSIRNTLHVLQRFKFLFNLPVNIERNIQKGDYGVVINDYEKAKSLFSDTTVDIFKKVYSEVEKRIKNFRSQLKKEIQKLPSPLTRQKTLIRYLLGLGDSGDPAWECLLHQHNWIQESMLKCKDDHLREAIDFAAHNNDEERVKVMQDYLEKLARIALGQIPEHWSLWQQYSTGVILSETGEKLSDVENLKQAAATHSKEMKGLLRDTVILFVNLIRAAFLPATLPVEDEEDANERESYGVWPTQFPLPATALSECVRCIREALSTLSRLNLPQGTLQSLKDVIHDLRVLCLSRFLQEATEDVKGLKGKETWEVNNQGVTGLPQQMNILLTELLTVARDVLQSLPGEESVFARIAVQKRINQLLNTLFLSCVLCFERTSFLDDEEMKTEAKANLPPLKTRLIVGLSNLANMMNNNHFSNLLTQFAELQFPQVDQTKKLIIAAVTELDAKLFEAYLENRVEPVTEAIEPAMYAGGFNWSECLNPTAVRPYIKMALMNVVAIHAEVYTICPALISRVLTEVIKLMAEELNRLIHCVTRISVNGSLQAWLDIEAFRQATLAFSTSQSQSSFDEALATLAAPTSNNVKTTLNELVNRFKSNMIFQLRCFDASS